MVRVNRVADFVERVGWTTIQAASAAALTAISSPDLTWDTGLKMVGIAAAVAALKVIVAQNIGKTPTGDAIPGGVIEPDTSVR